MTIERLLRPDLIPDSLWDRGSSRLLLPPALADAYRTALQEAGLIDLSNQRSSEEPPVGGASQEETDKHFAQAFDGSVARVQLAVLDPNGDVASVSDAFIRCLSGNQLCLVDAPCGAGAATLSFLTTIAELRKRGVVPRQPLDVMFVGAEISGPARTRAADMIHRLKDTLESQAIFLTEHFLVWDVTCKFSNTDLIKCMVLKSASAAKTLLVIANFNGFLERGGKKKAAEPQLADLLRFGSDDAKENVGIWIEPQSKPAFGILDWFGRNLSNAWRKFVRRPTNSAVLTASARFQDPIHSDSTPRVNLAVIHFDLERQP